MYVLKMPPFFLRKENAPLLENLKAAIFNSITLETKKGGEEPKN